MRPGWWIKYVVAFVVWYLIAGVLILAGLPNSTDGSIDVPSVIGGLMIIGSPTVVPIVGLVVMLIGFNHNWNTNRRLVERVGQMRRAGKLTGPFSPEEDALLLECERRMLSIAAKQRHPLIWAGGVAATTGLGAYEVAKLPGRINRSLGG